MTQTPTAPQGLVDLSDLRAARMSAERVKLLGEALSFYAKNGGTVVSQNDAAMAAEDIAVILDRITALEEQARADGEAGRALDNALIDMRDAFVRDGVYSGAKGAAIKSMNRAITAWRARARLSGDRK